MTDLPASVLFACTTNSVRSPMAACLLRHLHGDRILVGSAGVGDGEVDTFAVSVMAEWGLDISGHEPMTFDDLEDSVFDLVISLSPEAQHRAVELTRDRAVEIEFWRILDPTAIWGSREQRLTAYRTVRDDLQKRIVARFPPPIMGAV
jgi:protein-tyrosine-phosphatase